MAVKKTRNQHRQSPEPAGSAVVLNARENSSFSRLQEEQLTLPPWLLELIASALRYASIRAALAEAFVGAVAMSGERPELLTPDELCSELQISRSKLDGLIAAGLPFVKVGAVRRFRLVEVIEHLRSRDEEQAA